MLDVLPINNLPNDDKMIIDPDFNLLMSTSMCTYKQRTAVSFPSQSPWSADKTILGFCGFHLWLDVIFTLV